MVVRYNQKSGGSYINSEFLRKNVSQLRAVDRLTAVNRKFLESLGFQLVGGKKRVEKWQE